MSKTFVFNFFLKSQNGRHTGCLIDLETLFLGQMRLYYQILLKICQPKVKKADNPSQFGTPCIPSLFKPGSEFVHLELPMYMVSWLLIHSYFLLKMA